MKKLNSNTVWFSYAMLSLLGLVLAGQSRAVILLQPSNSGVQSRFASQSQAYMDSDPVGLNPWPFSGAVIYPSGAPIPSLPPAPAPSVSAAPGNPFSGGGWTSNFNDLLGPGVSTVATSTLSDSFLPAPTQVADTSVVVVNWTLAQSPLAPGYAYNQLNFGANYFITDNVGLSGSTPNFPLFVSGSTAGGAGNFAKFDALIEYTWFPGKYDFFPGGTFYPDGPSVSLGTLAYSYFNNSGGTFSASLFSSGSLAGTTDPDGVLSITGYMWIAGDPYTFNVSSIPEPASIGLLLVGGVGLLRRRR